MSDSPLVRAFQASVNKHGLCTNQLDVAFLYGEMNDDIYIEIAKGINVSREYKEKHVWTLKKLLEGLKISPQK